MKTPLIVIVSRSSYWSSQLVIAAIRYVFVTQPVMINKIFPTKKGKGQTFTKNKQVILETFWLRMTLDMLELLIAAKFNQVHDIFLQFCLSSYPVKATKDV